MPTEDVEIERRPPRFSLVGRLAAVVVGSCALFVLLAVVVIPWAASLPGRVDIGAGFLWKHGITDRSQLGGGRKEFRSELANGSSCRRFYAEASRYSRRAVALLRRSSLEPKRSVTFPEPSCSRSSARPSGFPSSSEK